MCIHERGAECETVALRGDEGEEAEDFPHFEFVIQYDSIRYRLWKFSCAYDRLMVLSSRWRRVFSLIISPQTRD